MKGVDLMEIENKDFTTKAGRQIQYQLIDFDGYLYWMCLGNGKYAVDLQYEQEFLEIMDADK